MAVSIIGGLHHEHTDSEIMDEYHMSADDVMLITLIPLIHCTFLTHVMTVQPLCIMYFH